MYITDQSNAENVSDSDLSSLSSDNEEVDEDQVAVVQLACKLSGGPVCLGEWEQHTKVSLVFFYYFWLTAVGMRARLQHIKTVK